MAILEQHPPRVRRKIAFLITLGVGVILIALLVLKATRPMQKKTSESAPLFRSFFESLKQETPSTSGQK